MLYIEGVILLSPLKCWQLVKTFQELYKWIYNSVLQFMNKYFFKYHKRYFKSEDSQEQFCKEPKSQRQPKAGAVFPVPPTFTYFKPD